MQVRKFEAKSMKEALEMVKTQLGPDAIILSAKDNSKGFGLAGSGSVEITAAVSEETLHKKKFAESRMREIDKQKIQRAPAKVQKKFIDGMVEKYTQENAPKKEITRTPYIDIDNEQMSSMLATPAQERVKTAAQKAWNAMQVHGEWVEPKTAATESSNTELQSLKHELVQLKKVLDQFQSVPQNVLQQYPGSEYGLPYDFAPVFEKLVYSGVATEIVAEILLQAQKQMPVIKFKNRALIEGWVAKYILDSTLVVGDMQGSKAQVFLGPVGSGKTSAIVKLASHYVVHARKKIALITTDTFKVGAADQLRIYAQILNVPFAIVRSASDWDYILQQLSSYDYILCDYPGTSLKTLEEIQQMKALLPKKSEHVTHHLVLNSTAKDQDLTEMGKRYKSVHFDDVIFTCVDDSAQHGSIYNFVKRFQVPLHSFGIGPRVPEDFEIATRERVLDLIFKLTKIKKED